MQPYIRRNHTDESGYLPFCLHITHTWQGVQQVHKLGQHLSHTCLRPNLGTRHQARGCCRSCLKVSLRLCISMGDWEQ